MPVVWLVEEEYYINYQIAHIRGAKESGPRYDPNMSEEERKAFSNLILLCKPHHDHVDKKHRHEYPPEMLLRWKADREAEGQDALAGLTRLTEEDLQNIIFDAFAAKHDQIMETLERLEKKDSDAANVMRELLDELDQMRTHGPFLNPDYVELLSGASNRLAHLGDNAAMLLSAASELATLGISEVPDTLTGAGSALANEVESLTAIVARLEDLRGQGWQ